MQLPARRSATSGGESVYFRIGCAALGFSSVLIDDFSDKHHPIFRDSVLHLHESYGVRIIEKDVIGEGISFDADSFDVVTSFDSMEHWHHSPKQLFHQVKRILRPGGLFFLGVPNCINLRKRITIPLGVGSWSSMQDWYDRPVFRGHVREAKCGGSPIYRKGS